MRRKLLITVDDDVLKYIDDFRFKHRFPTRLDAIRWLIDFAIEQKPRPERATQKELAAAFKKVKQAAL